MRRWFPFSSAQLTVWIIVAVAFSGCAINKKALEAKSVPKSAPPAATVTPASLSPFPETPKPVPVKSHQPYTLGVEDVVRVSVINNTDLDTVQSVRPDGHISFFPTGDIRAEGRTVEDVRQDIIAGLKTKREEVYFLGVNDVITITVYNHKEFNISQAIRPDGFISVIPAGEIKAEGLSINQLREQVTGLLTPLINNPVVSVVVEDFKSRPLMINDPIVNVTVEEYNSRKVAILGAVERPGILKMKSETTLLEGISTAGGLTLDADLRRAMVFRNRQLLPNNLERLFKRGDISQNISLQAKDIIYIPSKSDNKVYVIGKVNQPGVVNWSGDISLLEAIALAGGYAPDAQDSNVLIINGGLVEPTLTLVDARSITKEGHLERNFQLESGDIIYVPETVLASVERYFVFASRIIQPILAAESGIVIGDSVKKVFTGDTGQGSVGTAINLNTN